MRPVDQSRRRRLPPFGGLSRLLASVVVLLMLAGCQGGYGSRQGDPFFGMNAPPRPVAPATGTAANRPPPLPASISVPSQAALAGGTTPTPDNPRDLRITTPPVVPVSSPTGATRGVAPNNVRVEGPVPVPESTSRTMPAPPPPGGAMTFEEALQYLKKKGVVWQRLDGDQGQWKFQCSLPIPGRANMNRTYETTTPLPSDPLSAVRAVIEKIDKDQR